MPQQVLHRTAAGLIANRNPLFAEEGALVVAENVVCDREGVLSNRRGFSRHATVDADACGEYLGTMLILSGSTLYRKAADGTLTAFSGSYLPPAGGRMRFCEVGGSCYFTTTEGIYKLDSLTGTPRKAGMPPGLDVQVATAAGPTWFTNDTAVAYRVVWIHVDANNVEVSGEPSWRVILANSSGGNKGVTLTSTVPSDITVGDYYEIYRTELSATAADDPGDEMFLLARVAVPDPVPTTITFSDTYDPIFLGQPLYTNASEDGILQVHSRPPLCNDICLYKGYLNFAGSTSKEHRKQLQLLTVTGITDDADTISITDGSTVLTYTFSAAENIATHKFQRFTGGTTAENLRNTVESLCKVINRDTDNSLVYCFYASGTDDPPGIFKIQARELGTDTLYFTATAGCSAMFSPTIPTTGTTLVSDNLARKDRMYFSRFQAPDHVPEAVNYDDFGSQNSDIIRVMALTTSLIVLKEDGVWRRTGEDDVNFYDLPLDPSVSIVCRDAPCILDNTVYAVALEGICKVSDSGVAIISWPIDIALKRIFSYADWQELSFGTEYHSDFKYILWTPEHSTDTYCNIGWVWNHLTSKWTQWRKAVKCGMVLSETDRLYLGHAVDGYLLEERKSYHTSLDDFKDESIPVTITNINSTTITLTYTYTAESLAAGWSLEQPLFLQSSSITSVTSLGGNSYRVVVSEELPALQLGAAFVTMPITSIVRWKPEVCGNPATSKHWLTMQDCFEDEGAIHFEVGFNTDINGTISWYDKVLDAPTSGWGLGEWGETEWGDSDPQKAPVIRTMVPTPYCRSRTLSTSLRHSWAKERWSLLDHAYTFETTGEVTTVR